MFPLLCIVPLPRGNWKAYWSIPGLKVKTRLVIVKQSVRIPVPDSRQWQWRIVKLMWVFVGAVKIQRCVKITKNEQWGRFWPRWYFYVFYEKYSDLGFPHFWRLPDLSPESFFTKFFRFIASVLSQLVA